MCSVYSPKPSPPASMRDWDKSTFRTGFDFAAPIFAHCPLRTETKIVIFKCITKTYTASLLANQKLALQRVNSVVQRHFSFFVQTVHLARTRSGLVFHDLDAPLDVFLWSVRHSLFAGVHVFIDVRLQLVYEFFSVLMRILRYNCLQEVVCDVVLKIDIWNKIMTAECKFSTPFQTHRRIFLLERFLSFCQFEFQLINFFARILFPGTSLVVFCTNDIHKCLTGCIVYHFLKRNLQNNNTWTLTRTL